MDLLSGVISIASWLGEKAVESAVAAIARRLPEDKQITAHIKRAISSELANLGDQIASVQTAKLKGALTDYQNAISRICSRANGDLQPSASETKTLLRLTVDAHAIRNSTVESNQIMRDLQSAKDGLRDLIADEKSLALEQRINAVTTAMKCAILLEANLNDAWVCCAGYLSLFYECNDVKRILTNERSVLAKIFRQKASTQLILDFSDSVLVSLARAGVHSSRAVPDVIEEKVYSVMQPLDYRNGPGSYRERVFFKVFFSSTCLNENFYSAINFIAGKQLFSVLKGQNCAIAKSFFGEMITLRDVDFCAEHEAIPYCNARLLGKLNRLVFEAGADDRGDYISWNDDVSASQFVGIPVHIYEIKRGCARIYYTYPMYTDEKSGNLMCLVSYDMLWISVRYWNDFKYHGNHLPQEIKL